MFSNDKQKYNYLLFWFWYLWIITGHIVLVSSSRAASVCLFVSMSHISVSQSVGTSGKRKMKMKSDLSFFPPFFAVLLCAIYEKLLRLCENEMGFTDWFYAVLCVCAQRTGEKVRIWNMKYWFYDIAWKKLDFPPFGINFYRSIYNSHSNVSTQHSNHENINQNLSSWICKIPWYES